MSTPAEPLYIEPPSYNLMPGQYQIGGLVFGRYTDIPVSKVDPQPYNVNVQDFQVIRSDERSFGIDTLAPSNVMFTMAVLDNYVLPNMHALSNEALPASLVSGKGVLLPQLVKEWKANEVRPIWGQTKPLYFCDLDGVVRRVYGRPGKMTYSRRTMNGLWFDVQAEFRRSDTYAYSDLEYFVGPMPPNAPPVYASRLDGNADAWMRFYLTGPLTHPIVSYGGNTLELNVNIPAGISLEVNSYPWERRVLDTAGNNWRAYVIGNTVYLDQMTFPVYTQNMPITWTANAGSTNSSSQLYFMWRESYQVV